ncbi:MAG TPA: hypothetical protein VFK32_08455, partial [Tepidiformaceae bacterium]|nr:hypothetical protein [Tepidiformaceae bacterium]
SPTPVVTRTPQRGATAVPTRAIAGDSSGDDGGVSTITIGIILGAIMLGLFAALLYLWVLVRSRQRSNAVSAPPPPIDPPPPDAT